MLEYYYDFLDKYVDWRDFEYVYMDTNSVHFTTRGECLRDFMKPELLKVYDKKRKVGLQHTKATEHLIERQAYLRLNLLVLRLLL